jgi:hypothetical protein
MRGQCTGSAGLTVLRSVAGVGRRLDSFVHVAVLAIKHFLKRIGTVSQEMTAVSNLDGLGGPLADAGLSPPASCRSPGAHVHLINTPSARSKSFG